MRAENTPTNHSHFWQSTPDPISSLLDVVQER